MKIVTPVRHRSRLESDSMTHLRTRAEHWLLSSGICILDRTNPNYGAVHSYFDRDKAEFELIYSEAAGYVISLLKYLYFVREDAELVKLAKASGDWLSRTGEKFDGIIVMGQRHGDDIRRAYAFDNGICCKGLLDLYELTREEGYLVRAARIAEWLVNTALNVDGSVRPVLDVTSGVFVEDGSLWYEVSGSFHAKVAMSLLQLYSINGDGRALNGAMRICAWALGQQDTSGSFPVNRRCRAVNLHFHCYTVEALLYAYALTGEEAFRDAATRAVEWLAGVQTTDGGFWLWHDGSFWTRSKTSYVGAQASRVFLMMYLLNRNGRLMDAALRAARFLSAMQTSDYDRRIDGGFLEEEMAWYALAGRRGRRVTSWATMFAVHALDLLERVQEEEFHHAMNGMF